MRVKGIISLLCVSTLATGLLGSLKVNAAYEPGTDCYDEYVVFSESINEPLVINGNHTSVNGMLYSNYSVEVPQDLSSKTKCSDGSYIRNTYNFAEAFMNFNGEINSYDDSIVLQGNEISENAFAQKNIDINASTVKMNHLLGANENVDIGCKDMYNDNQDNESFIFASNGDLTINADNIDIKGVIYAPNGCVKIKANNLNFIGIIIANKVEINANQCSLNCCKDILQKYKIDTYDITAEDKIDDIDIISCGLSSSGNAYYYNTGTNFVFSANYNKYKLLSSVKQGDIIFEAQGGHGITGHIAYVEGIYYKTETYYYSSYHYTTTYSNIRLIEAIDCGVCRSILDDTRCDDKEVSIMRLIGGLSSSDYTNINYFMTNQISKEYKLDFAHDTSINEEDWYCSELVWAAYKYAGYDIERTGILSIFPFILNEPGVTPRDFLKDNNLFIVSYK